MTHQPIYKDIKLAPRNTLVIVVSHRFPKPHEALLYDSGEWCTFGVNGAWRDDPVMFTEMPAAPLGWDTGE